MTALAADYGRAAACGRRPPAGGGEGRRNGARSSRAKLNGPCRAEDRSPYGAPQTTLLPETEITALSLFHRIALSAPGDLDPTFSDDWRSTSLAWDDGRPLPRFVVACSRTAPCSCRVTTPSGSSNGAPLSRSARLAPMPSRYSFSDDGRQLVGPCAWRTPRALQASGHTIVFAGAAGPRPVALLASTPTAADTTSQRRVVGIDFGTGPESPSRRCADDGISSSSSEERSNMVGARKIWAIALKPYVAPPTTTSRRTEDIGPLRLRPDFAFGVRPTRLEHRGSRQTRPHGRAPAHPTGGPRQLLLDGHCGRYRRFPGGSAGSYRVALRRTANRPGRLRVRLGR